MWYRDPRHPELGPMFCPDSEAAAGGVPPGMITCDPPPGINPTVWTDPTEQPFDWTGWVDLDSTADNGTVVTNTNGIAVMNGWISPENIARAFGVPAEAVSPSYATMNADQAPQEELDRRLAQQRCYWCGVPLGHDDPVDMFCREDHAFAWRHQRTTKPYEVFSRADYQGGEDRYLRPDPGDTRPSWLGGPIRDTDVSVQRPAGLLPPTLPSRPGRRPIAEAVPAPEAHAPIFAGPGIPLYPMPDMPARWDWKIQTGRPARRDDHSDIPHRYALEQSRLRTPGIIAPSIAGLPEHAARRAYGDSVAVGYAPLWQDVPALRELRDPPTLDRGGWPAGHLEYLQRAEGWRLACSVSLDDREAEAYAANEPCPVPMFRRCEHCTEIGLVTIHTANFEVPVREAVPEEAPYGATYAEAVRIDVRRASTLVCGRCFLPYTGPICVPLWRHHPTFGDRDVLELLLVGALNRRVIATTQRISTQALESSYREASLVRQLWESMLREARQQTTPWLCAAPHDPTPQPHHHPYEGGTPATHWVSLTAGLQAWGWTVTPMDEEPIVLGLCPTHMMDLHHGLLTDPRMHARVSWDVVDRRALLVVA